MNQYKAQIKQIFTLNKTLEEISIQKGLPKILQVPCHHVLANQNSLKFKKGAPLKQSFNINLGTGIIKKNYFSLFVFSTYLPLFLLKF